MSVLSKGGPDSRLSAYPALFNFAPFEGLFFVCTTKGRATAYPALARLSDKCRQVPILLFPLQTIQRLSAHRRASSPPAREGGGVSSGDLSRLVEDQQDGTPFDLVRCSVQTVHIQPAPAGCESLFRL